MTKEPQTWIKSDFGLLPYNDEAKAAYKRIKAGGVVKTNITKMRNGKFHRKLWSLFKLAYDNFDMNPEKPMSFDAFRKNLIILAGYYEQVFDIDGNMHLEAKSISFAKMDEAEFERLYSAIIDVILQKVMTGSNAQEIDDQVMQVISFC